MKKNNESVSKESVTESAQKFLSIARMDINVACLAYSEGYYPHAIFNLQQSVEKGIKAFGLYFQIIDFPKMKRSISHQPLKVFEIATKSLIEQIDDFNVLCMERRMDPLMRMIGSPKTSKKLKEELELLKCMTKNEEESLNLTKGQISRILAQIRNLKKDCINAEKHLENLSLTQADCEVAKSYISRIFYQILKDDPEKLSTTLAEIEPLFDIGTYSQLIRQTLQPTMKPLYLSGSFFYLAHITQGHAILSKYPELDFDPVLFYTEKHPIIQKFPEIHEIVAENLDMLKGIIEA